MVHTVSRVHRGPSVYSRGPVIRYAMEGADPQAVAGRLSAFFAGLRDHRSPCQMDTIQHLFEHVGIELQNRAGAELYCVRAQGARVAAGDAVLPYEEERVGLEAGRLALETIESPPADEELKSRLRSFLRFAERHRLPVQDRTVVRVATSRDIPVLRIAGRLIQLGHGCHQQRMSGTETSRTNVVSNATAANKDYARRVLQGVGLPVPKYERVHRERDAVAAAESIGYPVVVKPNNRNMGIGVSVGMNTPREVRLAFRRAREYDRSILVEQLVAGSDYRMLVIDGRLAAAAKRVPAHVVGDGVRTVEDLVRRANDDPRRGAGQRSSWTKLELDEEADRLLAERGYDRGSVPPGGEAVFLRRVANTSAGGTAVDVTDDVHPDNRVIAERAARAIGLDIAGVDLLVPDITQSMRTQGGVICEINSRPGIRKHLWPAEGRPRDVIGPILDMLFPTGSRSRVPIAVVTGAGDTAGVARLLTDLLAADGSIVGRAGEDGVFIGGSRADGGGLDGPSAARLLLLDPAVEYAVLEVPPGQAFEQGLGYDWADACAVVGDEPIESSDLIDGLRLVAASTRSHVVLPEGHDAGHGLRIHPGAHVWRVGKDAATYAKALAQCLGTSLPSAIVS